MDRGVRPRMFHNGVWRPGANNPTWGEPSGSKKKDGVELIKGFETQKKKKEEERSVQAEKVSSEGEEDREEKIGELRKFERKDDDLCSVFSTKEEFENKGKCQNADFRENDDDRNLEMVLIEEEVQALVFVTKSRHRKDTITELGKDKCGG